MVLTLSAVTATCSENSIAPKNARELAALIKNVIPTSPSKKVSTSELNLDQINRGVSKGKALEAIKEAEQTKAYTAGLAIFQPIYSDLHTRLENLYNTCRNNSLPVKKRADNPIRISSPSNYHLWFGDDPESKGMELVIDGSIIIPAGHFNYNNETSIFCLRCIRDFRMPVRHSSYGHLQKYVFVSLERTGELVLRDQNQKLLRQTNMDEVESM